MLVLFPNFARMASVNSVTVHTMKRLIQEGRDTGIQSIVMNVFKSLRALGLSTQVIHPVNQLSNIFQMAPQRLHKHS